MRTSARFQDPSDVEVTITLRGKLSEFEALSKTLTADEPHVVPFYQVSELVRQISSVSSALRENVHCSEEDTKP